MSWCLRLAVVQLGFPSRLPPTVHRVQLTSPKNTPAPIFQFAPDSNPKPNSNLIQNKSKPTYTSKSTSKSNSNPNSKPDLQIQSQTQTTWRSKCISQKTSNSQQLWSPDSLRFQTRISSFTVRMQSLVPSKFAYVPQEGARMQEWESVCWVVLPNS